MTSSLSRRRLWLRWWGRRGFRLFRWGMGRWTNFTIKQVCCGFTLSNVSINIQLRKCYQYIVGRQWNPRHLSHPAMTRSRKQMALYMKLGFITKEFSVNTVNLTPSLVSPCSIKNSDKTPPKAIQKAKHYGILNEPTNHEKVEMILDEVTNMLHVNYVVNCELGCSDWRRPNLPGRLDTPSKTAKANSIYEQPAL